MKDAPKLILFIIISPAILIFLIGYGVLFPIVLTLVFAYHLIKPNRYDR